MATKSAHVRVLNEEKIFIQFVESVGLSRRGRNLSVHLHSQ